MGGMSSTLTSINFIATVLTRTVSMLMLEITCYNYSVIVTAILLYLVLPMFGLSVLLLCSDIYLSTDFFGHPEVYVIIIGMVTATYMITHVYGETILIVVTSLF